MSNTYTDRYQTLLKRLTQARIDVGLTQEEVASRLNKPQSYISKVESGERRIDVIELEDLCHIYNTPLSNFTTRADSATPKKGACDR